jgi:hypothetical protein
VTAAWVPLPWARRARDAMAGAVSRRGAILLPAIPLAVIGALLGMEESFAGWSRWAYLLQPIVVAVAYFVVGWSAPMPVKYLVMVVVSFVIMFAVYDLIVRRTRVTRFLFGIRA